MKTYKTILFYVIVALSIPFWTGCTQEEIVESSSWTEEELVVINEIEAERSKMETTVDRTGKAEGLTPIRNLQDLKLLLSDLRDMQLDESAKVEVEVYPIPQVKTRTEGMVIGKRYGIQATHSSTLFTHTLNVVYEEVNGDCTIKSAAYDVSGHYLGELTYGVEGVFKASSTSSSVLTWVTLRNYIAGYEVSTDTSRARWQLSFSPGGHVDVQVTGY